VKTGSRLGTSILLFSAVLVVVACALAATYHLTGQFESIDPASPPGKTAAPEDEVAVVEEERAVPRETERPAYSAPPVRARELKAFVDRNGKNRLSTDVTSRSARVRYEEDIPAVVSVLLDTDDDDTVRNEAANLLSRSAYKTLPQDLLRVLNNPKEGPRFRSFCIQHLWTNVKMAGPAERATIVSTLYEALCDRHIPVRREALLALVRMRERKGRETAVEWLVTDDVEKAGGVRDAAIRCVRELGLREHIPTIRKYLRDKNDVVRIAAIVTLSQWGDDESRLAIEEAAKSSSFRLRRCAAMALKRLDRATKTDGTPAVQPKADKEAPHF